MSSCGNPATEGNALMDRRSKFDKTRNCVKCKEKSGNIVIRHAVYCKDCFKPMITLKFRRGLESFINDEPRGSRRKELKASGNLLIALSGGVGSTALLDLVHQSYFSPRVDGAGGKAHPRNEPIWEKGRSCYVEICSAFPGMHDRTEGVRSLASSYPALDFVPLRLEDAFDESWWASVGGRPATEDLLVDFSNEDLVVTTVYNVIPSSSSPVDQLRSFLSTLPTQTAVSRAILILVRLLLLHTAKATDSSHLIFGTSLTSLSISLISSISQGAGFTVREEAQEEWTPQTNGRAVRIVRPLSDVGMKECAALAWWQNLPIVCKQRIPGSKQDISFLTKEFIVGLEKDYPSTVSTIARTCGKLAPKRGSAYSCILCERPVQEGIKEWKTSTSLRSLSMSPKDGGHSAPRHLTPYLCYACYTTLTSRSSRGALPTSCPLVRLPVWAASSLAHTRSEDLPGVSPGEVGDIRSPQSIEQWQTRKLNAEEMKHSIDEFLLPSDISR